MTTLTINNLLLKQLIDQKRESLLEIGKFNSLTSIEVVKISQELDSLILLFQKNEFVARQGMMK